MYLDSEYMCGRQAIEERRRALVARTFSATDPQTE